MRNTVKLSDDGQTAYILCDKADGTQVPVKVDIADLPKLAVLDYRWSVAQTNCSTTYCSTLAVTGKTKKRIYLHRLLMDFPANGMVVDHKDGDGLNCKRNNLQVVTQQENVAKMRITCKPRRHNRLGVKGVSRGRSGRYHVNFQGRYVGTFNTVEAAQRIYESLRTSINIARTGRP
ncbi:MAG TPA: HNH endonuclease [Bryobacteraceae bacterium]|nr:HNH endonuclease [Bryobacteraceae bacterium]